MVIKNVKTDKLMQNKDFAKRDTSYCSFWLYNNERDINSQHFKDKFVNFYDDKELLSEFNPAVAKNIISFWSEDGDVIFDPFAGRTRALVSYAMNRKYIGYEVSSDVCNYMETRFKELGLKERENFEVDIKCSDCINAQEDIKNESCDLVFSCPPYFNIEKYQSADGQLSDIRDYYKFLDALIKRLNIAVNKLKKDKFMCMVVGDFRKDKFLHTFEADLIQAMKENEKIILHDIIIIQNIPFHAAAYYFGSRRKYKGVAKAHEYLLVWKKVRQ